MTFNNVLKIEYYRTLKFSHFEGVGFSADVSLVMAPEDALKLLNELRGVLRDGNSQKDVYVSNYQISVTSYGNTALSILVMELRGEMSKPIGMFKYDAYMGSRSLLDGVSLAIKEIRSEM